MSELSIGHVRSLFHKNEPNRGFVEQVIQQIEKDASGLGELPIIIMNWDQPLVPQLVAFILKVEEAIVTKGNGLAQFYYRVDLPEELMQSVDRQSRENNSFQLQELVLLREAQKVRIREFYKNQTSIDE
jgi:hypothetical protein